MVSTKSGSAGISSGTGVVVVPGSVTMFAVVVTDSGSLGIGGVVVVGIAVVVVGDAVVVVNSSTAAGGGMVVISTAGNSFEVVVKERVSMEIGVIVVTARGSLETGVVVTAIGSLTAGVVVIGSSVVVVVIAKAETSIKSSCLGW